MTTVIAELGSSPMPDWDFDRWCAAAAAAGADAVKVQLFSVDAIYPPHMRDDMRPREFPRNRLKEFVLCAHSYGLTAGASVFDADAVALAGEWCDWLKLAASQEKNLKFYTQVWIASGQAGKRLYRSQSTLSNNLPLLQDGYVVPLYAIQDYPATMVLSLWRLMQWANWCRSHVRYGWGWSSHTTGTTDCGMAARFGASVIEKHFALGGNDCEAAHSLLPGKFGAMCIAIRQGERK